MQVIEGMFGYRRVYKKVPLQGDVQTSRVEGESHKKNAVLTKIEIFAFNYDLRLRKGLPIRP